VSLASLFAPLEAPLSGGSSLDINRLAFLICRGGWPGALDLDDEDALAQAFDYYDVVCDSDISRIDDVVRDPQRVRLLMRSYARHQGTMATVGTILADLKTNESSFLSDNTVYDYIKALKKIFVIEDMPAWNPNLRSKTAVRTSDNRYFIDPSIATAALGASPNDLINDLETMGLLFETLAVRDLRVYADALDGQVYHYRDKKGLECDAIVHLRDGSYGLIEIKLGGDKLIDEGAESLLRLQSEIDTTRMKSPAFLMVLTGVGDFPYTREDGVYVVPIGCLKP
jgi:predicted AAA+ superfamily ATPase